MRIEIDLPAELFAELQAAAAGVRELGFSAVTYAEELIASEMASRRLPSVPVSARAHGAHTRRAAASALVEDAEPEGYAFHLPAEPDFY